MRALLNLNRSIAGRSASLTRFAGGLLSFAPPALSWRSSSRLIGAFSALGSTVGRSAVVSLGFTVGRSAVVSIGSAGASSVTGGIVDSPDGENRCDDIDNKSSKEGAIIELPL